MSDCNCNVGVIAKLVCSLFGAIIIFLILLFIWIVINDFRNNNQIIDQFKINDYQTPRTSEKKKWTRSKDCKYLLSSTIAAVLKDYGISETNDSKFHMYMPCNYNDIEGEIKNIPNKNKCDSEFYFIVSNADELTAKDKLWKNLELLYGLEATKLMPQTYVLYDSSDIKKFINNYDPNKIYILKKNIQRQEGLKISRNKSEILSAHKKDKYVLVQELLQDPFIIDGRKTNMRFYLLIVCTNGKITAYVHDEGFMYYTAEKFCKNSIDHKVNITTGYIDRSVYDKNPLTLGDFRKYIDKNYNDANINSSIIFNRILDVMNKLTNAIGGTVCQDTSLFKCNTFQIFGVDIALNEQLIPQIMEVNKGPDLGGKDDRDLTIKKKVVADMFNKVGIIQNIENNQFRKVYPEIEYYNYLN